MKHFFTVVLTKIRWVFEALIAQGNTHHKLFAENRSGYNFLPLQLAHLRVVSGVVYSEVDSSLIYKGEPTPYITFVTAIYT